MNGIHFLFVMFVMGSTEEEFLHKMTNHKEISNEEIRSNEGPLKSVNSTETDKKDLVKPATSEKDEAQRVLLNESTARYTKESFVGHRRAKAFNNPKIISQRGDFPLEKFPKTEESRKSKSKGTKRLTKKDLEAIRQRFNFLEMVESPNPSEIVQRERILDEQQKVPPEEKCSCNVTLRMKRFVFRIKWRCQLDKEERGRHKSFTSHAYSPSNIDKLYKLDLPTDCFFNEIFEFDIFRDLLSSSDNYEDEVFSFFVIASIVFNSLTDDLVRKIIAGREIGENTVTTIKKVLKASKRILASEYSAVSTLSIIRKLEGEYSCLCNSTNQIVNHSILLIKNILSNKKLKNVYSFKSYFSGRKFQIDDMFKIKTSNPISDIHFADYLFSQIVMVMVDICKQDSNPTDID